MSITAKIQCSLKNEQGEGDNRFTNVTFTPDYQDGRNKEWSFATPQLDLHMTLRGNIADRFEQGKRYILTFTDEQ